MDAGDTREAGIVQSEDAVGSTTASFGVKLEVL
jgi:hypothetical protein